MHENLGAFGAQQAWTSRDASPCPNPHAVALFCRYALGKFVSGEGSGLTRDEAEQISAHMRECSRCVGKFNAIVDVHREFNDGAVARIWPGSAVGVAALVMAALALMFMVITQSTTDYRPRALADKFDRGEVLNIQRLQQPESHDVVRQAQSQPSAQRSSQARPRVRRPPPPVSSAIDSPAVARDFLDTEATTNAAP